MALTIEPAPMPLRTDADGAVRVGGTRVTLDTVIFAFEEGATPEEIALRYPTLDLADVYAVITFYLQRRSEVTEYVRQRQQEADALRACIESRRDVSSIRDRLLARKNSRDS